MIGSTASAWRQAVFFLSFCHHERQRDTVAWLRAQVDCTPAAARLTVVVDGLAHVVDGGRFDATGRPVGGGRGRRFLGGSVGPHWLVPPGRD